MAICFENRSNIFSLRDPFHSKKIYMRIITTNLRLLALFSIVAIFASACSTNKSPSAERQEMVTEARQALNDLYSSTPGARSLGANARGILVFPSIVKGGFIAGGQYGEGVLFSNESERGYYRSVAASWGLQAGIQKFGYVLFFMSDEDLKYINSSDGWEIGVGPTITVLDKGMAASMTTTTSRKGVFAFFFDQKGLMAGLGIQGTKITKLDL